MRQSDSPSRSHRRSLVALLGLAHDIVGDIKLKAITNELQFNTQIGNVATIWYPTKKVPTQSFTSVLYWCSAAWASGTMMRRTWSKLTCRSMLPTLCSLQAAFLLRGVSLIILLLSPLGSMLSKRFLFSLFLFSRVCLAPLLVVKKGHHKRDYCQSWARLQ